MRGNIGLFRTFSPKLPRIHVNYIVMQMRKINREKGYSSESVDVSLCLTWMNISAQIRVLLTSCKLGEIQ